jgi:MOSC domain-containing protein YiiM
MEEHAVILSVNTSEKKGVPKTPVKEARLRKDWGIEGDSHAGPWHRQVSLLAQESVDKMTALGIPGLTPGIFAENVTTQGITVHTLPVGARLRLGTCEVEVTQIGKECHHGCEIFRQVGKCVMPQEGIFVKVITEGTIRPGDLITLCPKDI